MAQRFGMNNVIPETPGWFKFLRFYQIFASFLVLVTASYALNFYGTWWGAGSLGFAIFTCIWSLIFLFSVVFIPICLPFFFFKWLALVAESITLLFWLCAWAVLASWSATWDPDNWNGHYPGSHDYSRGAAWGCVTVAAIFGSFTWITFCFTLFAFSLGVHRYRVDKQDIEMPTVAPAPEPAAVEAPAPAHVPV